MRLPRPGHREDLPVTEMVVNDAGRVAAVKADRASAIDGPTARRRSARRAGAQGVLAIGLALALVVSGCGGGEEPASPNGGADPTEEQAVPNGDRLLSQLRSGGLVIVFRHVATDPSDEDDPQVVLDDCSTQRNLVPEGRADSRAIGTAFRDLRIPVGAVWASPYCRARDTAELAFGRAQVVDGLERLFPELDEAADRRLNRLINDQAPAAGDPNLVISAHGVYPSVLEPAVPIDEGEAAIYAVRGQQVDLVGRLAPEEWAGLDAGAGSANGDGEPSAVTERVHSSVVSVQLGDGEHAGAGFRVAVDGIVVTAASVVEGAEDVYVASADGARQRATVIGSATDVDIAVLEIEDDSNLPPLHSGSGLAEARVGDEVLAVRSTRGPAPAVTPGALVDTGRPVRLSEGSDLEALVLDAAVQPSGAGGPVVNTRGEVLGVATVSARISGTTTGGRTGFAIPVDVARSAALRIVEARG